MNDDTLHGVVVSAGQPTKYKNEYVKQAYKLCLLGSTDKDMADFFEVAESTINLWKKAHPEFSESIKKGKDLADATVAESLYKRANGYEHPDEKIFNDNGQPLIVPTIKRYPPDTTAAIFWLKNRQRKNWRDRHEVDNTSSDGSMKPPQPLTPESAKAISKDLDDEY